MYVDTYVRTHVHCRHSKPRANALGNYYVSVTNQMTANIYPVYESMLSLTQMDLSFLLDSTGCECLNNDDDHSLENALKPGPLKYLESDCDEQVNHIFTDIWMNTNTVLTPNTNIDHNSTSFQASSQTSLTATHWTK